MAIGVKEIIKLGEEKINERFNLRGGKSGFAGEYVLGFLPEGVKAGGFLYTNKDTVSLGVVVSMKDLRKNGSTYSFDIIEEFAEHPYIAPMIEGGKVEEYSAHLVQEGGIQGVPKLYGNGYMIAGDAAGFSFSNGLVLQGMNYAIASGIAAAETAIEAKSKNNFSEEALAAYRERLMNSFVLRDLLDFRGIQGVTWSDTVHRVIPRVMEGVFEQLFTEDSQPKKHISRIVMDALSRSGMKTSDAIIEGYRMMRRM